jgi:glycosyltransferase involved in cell wall biosynthesis
VYSGIEATDFPIAADDAPVPDRSWRGQLLYVGRLDERKGVDTVVRALAELPGARLRIVGRGDNAYLVRLRELAARLQLADRVIFTAVDRSRLRSVYRQADVLVFPSVYDEPFGLVPLEAMACDTPVVATGRGGSGEYLMDGRNCLLFRAGDHARLAAAISRVAAHPELRAKLTIGGRRTARALTTDALAETLLAWHDAALAGFTHGQPADRELPWATPTARTGLVRNQRPEPNTPRGPW